MSVYVPETPKDLFRPLQLVSSGDVIADPSKFLAGPPANPNYFIPGKNWRFRARYDPVGFPIQTLTDENRTQVLIIKNSALIEFAFDLTDFAHNGFLSWLLELHKTDFEAHSGFYSRKPLSTERFKMFHGIVPDNVNIEWKETGEPVHVSGRLIACKPVAEGTTGPTIGSGSYATPPSAAAILTKDAGANSLKYDATDFKSKGMSVSVQHIYSVLDPDESEFVELMVPAARTISGRFAVFKKQGVDSIHADILSGALRTVTKRIKPFDNPTSGTSISLTDVRPAESDEDDFMQVRSESNLKDYSFTAGGLTLVELTS